MKAVLMVQSGIGLERFTKNSDYILDRIDFRLGEPKVLWLPNSPIQPKELDSLCRSHLGFHYVIVTCPEIWENPELLKVVHHYWSAGQDGVFILDHMDDAGKWWPTKLKKA